MSLEEKLTLTSVSLSANDLLEFLEEQKEGSYILDRIITNYAYDQQDIGVYNITRPFSENVDCIYKELITRILPSDARFSVGISNTHDYDGPRAHVWFPTRMKIFDAQAKTMPLALLKAVLKAKIYIDDKK